MAIVAIILATNLLEPEIVKGYEAMFTKIGKACCFNIAGLILAMFSINKKHWLHILALIGNCIILVPTLILVVLIILANLEG